MKRNLLKILIICLLIPFTAFSENYHSWIIKIKSSESLQKLQHDFPAVKINTQPIFSKFQLNDKYTNSLLAPDIRTKLASLNNYYNLYIPNNISGGTLIYEILKNPEVLSLEKNYNYRIEQIATIPNDPRFPEQWGLEAVNALAAWKKATGNEVIVGVVDTGIEWDHPELKHQLWINTKEDLNSNGTFEPWYTNEIRNGMSGDLNDKDDDGNGYEDDVIGYSFVNQFVSNLGNSSSFNPLPGDEHNHGTMISGVIAARNNNDTGISGLAYGARIMTLRAFDATGNAQADNIAAAIVYGALNGAKVLNFSFGEEYESTIVHDAVKFAYSLGCVMIASSGNNGWDEHHYPSDYEECLSVGASNKKNEKDWQSNYGYRLGLLAPGTEILTTTLGGDYRTASGTSLSSPFVSSVAAMLFELYPNLKPDEIYSILKSSAKDIDAHAWDYKTGSGILDADAALDFPGISSLQIIEPSAGDVINKSKKSFFSLTGSIVCPLFSSYQVLLGKGNVPFSWDTVTSESSLQLKNDTIANISTTGLEDTVYTVRILVNLKNNSTIEKNTYVQIVSDSTPLKVLFSKSLNAYFNEKRAVVVSAKTNQLTSMSVLYRPNNSSEPYAEILDKNYYSNFHTIVLTDEVPANKLIDAKIVCKRKDGVSITKSFTFLKLSDEMTSGYFQQKYNNLPMLYLYNGVGSFYGDGAQNFAADDISYGLWQSTKIFEFRNNEFIQRDSMSTPWIPVGYGDSNGDGVMEIFTKIFGSGLLFQSKQNGESPFSGIVYSDTLGNSQTAGAMFDFTGDGKEELITYTDTSFRLLSNINGKYEEIAVSSIDSPYNEIGSSPGIIWNLDNDNVKELAYTNDKGHLFVMEYQNGNLKTKYIDRVTNSLSPQFLSKADLDADGKSEIIMFNYGSNILFDQDEGGDVIWQLKILKSNGPYDYYTLYNDYFYGVRSGSTRSGVYYRNGMTCGNVDGIAGDELILSSYPNLYVLKWDKERKQLLPLWWYPYAFANEALINDFDKNNINEFAFSTFSGTKFFEYTGTGTSLEVPSGFRAYAVDESNARLDWNKQASAEKYIVYEVRQETGKLIAYEILRTDADSVTVPGLTNGKNYMFALRALNSTNSDSLSDFTNLADVFMHAAIKPESAYFLNRKSIIVKFSGKLPFEAIEPSLFTLNFQNGSEIIPVNIIQRASDSTFLIVLEKEAEIGDYKLDIKSFRDYYNSPSIIASVSFNFYIDEPEKEMYLKKLEVISNYRILLAFSDNIDSESGTNLNNYIIKPVGKIDKIELHPINKNEIYIDFDQSVLMGSLGITYSITAKNVLDESKLFSITGGAGNTLSFVFFSGDLSNTYVYPNPIKLSEKPTIRFANLTSKATVYIYTLGGVLKRTLSEVDGNGGVEWDGRDERGNELESGVYLYKVKGFTNQNKEIESELKKFTLIQ